MPREGIYPLSTTLDSVGPLANSVECCALIDAIFEVRFESKMPVSVILPGIFFNKLEGDKSIDALPIAQLPKPLRDADPNLKFAAVSRVDWTKFFINVSDASVSVSCKYPYPGWDEFQPAIVKIMEILAESNIVERVDRYSLKYVDILSGLDDEQKVSMLNMRVSLAGHDLKKEPFQLRLEIPKDGLVHAVQMVSAAKAVLHNGTSLEGLVVDVDTHCALDGISMSTLLSGFSGKLETIHAMNKAMFFDCITDETLKSLEPTYE